MSPIALPVLWIFAIPAVGSSVYLLVLTLLSARLPSSPQSTRTMRFDIIIPAHNEEAGIAEAVHSALSIDWPADRFRVIVVADNCADATAEIAAGAGAHVLIRQNSEQRGKGYALAYAFHDSRERSWADAVAVIDADSRVSTNLIEAMAARMERGEKAVQVHYGVSNINASWRTRLMTIAMTSFHQVRSRARERLGLSCGIRGNGWALTHALLEQVPYASFSLTEDLEFGIELGMRGVRVAYADEARCDGEMVSGGKGARSQRQRWEQGRVAVLRSRTLPLLKRAVTLRRRPLPGPGAGPAGSSPFVCLAQRGDANCCRMAVGTGRPGDRRLVLVRPAVLRGAVTVCNAWMAAKQHRTAWPARPVAGALLLFWKLAVMLHGRRATEWVRTNRERS